MALPVLEEGVVFADRRIPMTHSLPAYLQVQRETPISWEQHEV